MYDVLFITVHICYVSVFMAYTNKAVMDML